MDSHSELQDGSLDVNVNLKLNENLSEVSISFAFCIEQSNKQLVITVSLTSKPCLLKKSAFKSLQVLEL